MVLFACFPHFYFQCLLDHVISSVLLTQGFTLLAKLFPVDIRRVIVKFPDFVEVDIVNGFDKIVYHFWFEYGFGADPCLYPVIFCKF